MGILARLRTNSQRNGKITSNRRKTHSDTTSDVLSPSASQSIDLPFELWQRIFAYVCHLPDTLRIDLPDPFMTGGFIPVSKEEERANARDRRSVQLVCRAWRNIALEFVYDSLIICCRKHTLPLIEMLEGTKEHYEDRRGHGWFVKELEFRKGSCMDDQEVASQFLSTQEITRIIRCTPNLRIYRNSNDNQHKFPGRRTHWSVLSALGKHCGRSLLCLDWSGSECPRWDDLEVLLLETPNIQTLSCSHLLPSTARILQLRAHRVPMYLPHLRALSLGLFPEPDASATPTPSFTPSWHHIFTAFTRDAGHLDKITRHTYNDIQLPSLKKLSVNYIDILSANSSTKSFLSLYGPQLECLYTSNLTPKHWYPESYKWDSWNTTLCQLLELCPDLRSIIFNPMQPILYPTSHPTLERIGIFPPSMPPSDFNPDVSDGYETSIAKPVEDAMTKLSTAKFPRLRILRLSDTGLFEPLGCSPDWLELWIPIWKEKNIRFEDSNGLDHAIANFDMEGLDF